MEISVETGARLRYPSPGCLPLRAALRAPVDGRLFFCGEHCTEGIDPCVQAALADGARAAALAAEALAAPRRARPLPDRGALDARLERAVARLDVSTRRGPPPPPPRASPRAARVASPPSPGSSVAKVSKARFHRQYETMKGGRSPARPAWHAPTAPSHRLPGAVEEHELPPFYH